MSCAHDSHTHDHNSHQHDHSNDLPSDNTSTGDKSSLYGKIDIPNVMALNAIDGEAAGRKTIKPWDQREDETTYCESDADDSLIISSEHNFRKDLDGIENTKRLRPMSIIFRIVPFTAQVKLRSIILKTGPAGFTPEECQIYTNSPGLDFSSIEDQKPLESLRLVPQRSTVEYALKASKFNSVRSVQLFFPRNLSGGVDEETVRVGFIGFKGDWIELTQNPEGVIVYEAQANPADHKVKGTAAMGSSGLGF